jgi:hypothetical protein
MTGTLAEQKRDRIKKNRHASPSGGPHEWQEAAGAWYARGSAARSLHFVKEVFEMAGSASGNERLTTDEEVLSL